MALADRIIKITGGRGFRWSHAYQRQYLWMPSQWRAKLRSHGVIARLDDTEALRSDVIAQALDLVDEDNLLRVVSSYELLFQEEDEALPTDVVEWERVQAHPALDALPLGEDLYDSVKQNGLACPIVLDATGWLVDGRSRLAACLAADAHVRWVSLIDVAPGMDPATYAVLANSWRALDGDPCSCAPAKHLSPCHRLEVARAWERKSGESIVHAPVRGPLQSNLFE